MCSSDLWNKNDSKKYCRYSGRIGADIDYAGLRLDRAATRKTIIEPAQCACCKTVSMLLFVAGTSLFDSITKA